MYVTMGRLTGDPGDAVVQVPELESVEIPVLTPAVLQRGLVLELDCLLYRGAITLTLVNYISYLVYHKSNLVWVFHSLHTG